MNWARAVMSCRAEVPLTQRPFEWTRRRQGKVETLGRHAGAQGLHGLGHERKGTPWPEERRMGAEANEREWILARRRPQARQMRGRGGEGTALPTHPSGIPQPTRIPTGSELIIIDEGNIPTTTTSPA
ncbi:hypothetical protein GPALN_013024 [Globodera pallida]|nr:hypothetical protein GPALN_013024 [Globodera pallida]